MLQVFAAILLLCAAAPRTHAQTERIRDFHSDIRLLDDGTLLVKETITVVSAGNQIRHGIAISSSASAPGSDGGSGGSGGGGGGGGGGGW
jgi:hypothetical protein